MTNGLTMHGAKTSSNVKEKWRSMRKRAAEKQANRSCTAGTVPAAILKASRLCAGRLHQGHHAVADDNCQRLVDSLRGVHNG